MSYKRDGDDFSQLNVLKKRRVAELFAHHIPDDEAVLMKNGRYACTVCHKRPVFDTLDVLTIHRRGKKHLQCLESQYRKKRELMALVEKRRHENYVKREESGHGPLDNLSPLLTITRERTQNALLKATPYNSCVKWGRPEKVHSDGSQQTQLNKTKGTFFTSTRKKHLESTSKSTVNDGVNLHDVTLSSSNQRQPSSAEQNAYESSNCLKSLPKFAKAKPDIVPIELKPYISKFKRKATPNCSQSDSSERCLSPPSLSLRNIDPDISVPITVFEQDHLTHHCLNEPINNTDTCEKMPERRLIKTDAKATYSTMIYEEQKAINNFEDEGRCSQPQKPDEHNARQFSISTSKNNISVAKQLVIATDSGTMHSMSEEKKQEIKHILKLTSSGWKRDRGTWVREEGVEFDSDEEPPTI